jgi:hypothetical protein
MRLKALGNTPVPGVGESVSLSRVLKFFSARRRNQRPGRACSPESRYLGDVRPPRSVAVVSLAKGLDEGGLRLPAAVVPLPVS